MAKKTSRLPLLFSLILAAAPAAAAPVTVIWDPNPEPDIVSYIVRWGTRSGTYTNAATVDARRTSWVSPDLLDGRSYYFVVQAVNADGLSSPYSEEVSILIPGVSSTVAADFSGTGTADFTVFRRSRGQWYIRGGRTITFGAASDVPVVGDYDGDGVSDIALWRPSTGVWSVLQSSHGYATQSMLTVQWGSQSSGDIPVPADYDGDGLTDIAVWRRPTGTWYILRSREQYSTATMQAVQWGVAKHNDVPVPADYDGDGATDIAVWRANNGCWYILHSSEGFSVGPRAVQWGVASQKDIPVPGDYDGDGMGDIAVWRPASGTWYILGSATGYDPSAFFAVQWGASRDIPVPADFDGDGVTDIGVWRPSNGTWYVLKSSLQFSRFAPVSVQWGVESQRDVPATGTVPLAASNPALVGY